MCQQHASNYFLQQANCVHDAVQAKPMHHDPVVYPAYLLQSLRLFGALADSSRLMRQQHHWLLPFEKRQILDWHCLA